MNSVENEVNEKVRLISETQDTVRSKRLRVFAQDMGIFVFMIGIFAAAGATCAGGTENLMENSIMFLLLALGVILAGFHFRFLSIAWGILITCGYIVTKIVSAFMYDRTIELYSYFWLIIPILTIGSFLFFMQNAYKTQVLSDMLIRQIDSMEAIDPLTRLFNKKSLYSDLERQMAYARRNNVPLTLLVIHLKYAEEMKEILTRVQFDELKVRLASLLEDVVRLEDRIYSIGNDGEMAIISFCNHEGAVALSNRLRKSFFEKAAFEDILNHALKVELKIGILEYNEELYENSIEFTKKTENELQYDV